VGAAPTARPHLGLSGDSRQPFTFPGLVVLLPTATKDDSSSWLRYPNPTDAFHLFPSLPAIGLSRSARPLRPSRAAPACLRPSTTSSRGWIGLRSAPRATALGSSGSGHRVPPQRPSGDGNPVAGAECGRQKMAICFRGSMRIPMSVSMPGQSGISWMAALAGDSGQGRFGTPTTAFAMGRSAAPPKAGGRRMGGAARSHGHRRLHLSAACRCQRQRDQQTQQLKCVNELRPGIPRDGGEHPGENQPCLQAPSRV